MFDPGGVIFCVHELEEDSGEFVVFRGKDGGGADQVVGLEAHDVFEAGAAELVEGSEDVGVVVEVDAAEFN